LPSYARLDGPEGVDQQRRRPQQQQQQQQQPLYGEDASMGFVAFMVSAGLAVQGAAFVLLRSYLKSDVCDSWVLMYSEVIKFLFSFCFSYQHWRLYFTSTGAAVVPVITYGIMNLLSFWSLKRLPAVLSIIIIQLKLVFTALFSRIFLKRPLLTTRSFALSALVFACISITRYEQILTDQQEFAEVLRDGTAQPFHRSVNMLAAGGLVLETMLSGLMSVYMQTLFEMHPVVMWRRNTQLAAWSTAFYTGVALLNHDCAVAPRSWTNPDLNSVYLAFLSAAGGVLVALSILYAGAVGKVVATSASVALTVLAEAVFVNLQLPDVLLSSLCLSALNAVIMYSTVK